MTALRIKTLPIRPAVNLVWRENRLRGGFEPTVGSDLSEETAPIAFMTRAADLANLDQEDVAVAVDRDRLDVLNVPRGSPFVPVGLARARIKMRLAGRDRPLDRSRVHPSHHQDLGGLDVLHNRRDEAVARPLNGAEQGGRSRLIGF